jgi:hypothetical protein
VVLADEPRERILVPAPKRVEDRRFLKAHGQLPLPGPLHPAAILPSSPSAAATRLAAL